MGEDPASILVIGLMACKNARIKKLKMLIMKT
jgi:hypothetical protein